MDRRLAKLMSQLGREAGPALVCGHRGNKGGAPENTLCSFQSAIDIGVDLVECDIHLTRDNQIVISHDDDVARCSNGKGLVRELTLRQLQRLDFGAWFSPRFAGERIPTLAEALELMKGKVVPVIEVKRDKQGYDPALEPLLLKTLEQFGMKRSVIVISFNAHVLKRLRELDAAVFLGALGRTDPVFLPKWIQGWHPQIEEINEERMRDAHDGGHWVLPWNANDWPAMRRAIGLGADIVSTDWPAIIVPFVRELAGAAALRQTV